MPSTNKLFSLGQSQRSSRHVVSNIAKFLLSFCGIASFGVVTMLSLTLLSFTTIFGANNASATSATGSTSNNVSVGISSSVAIRLLDSTATFDITRLDFDLTPTASGVTTTKRTVVDVATSNPTGYKLYMQSNYQDHSGNYTTNLVHSYTDVSDTIPTSINSGDKVYWNYTNPLTSTINTIPAHGSPERIAQNLEQTNSDQTPVDINVSVDTSIVSGTYTNQLLFSAVANTSPLPYTLYFTPGTGTMAGTTIEEQAAASIHTITIPSTAEYIPNGTNGLFTYWEIQDPTTASCSRNSNNTTSGNNNNNNNDTSICYPGDNITIDATIDSQGEIAGKATLIAHYASISTMQAMAPNICTVAYTGASTTLTDTRDTKTYTIRKLKDNNCWMTQNLDFLPTAGTTISSTTSNVALSTTLQTTDSTKSNYLTDDCSTTNTDKYCIAYSNNAEHPEYGTYYNWYAATAGTGTSTMVSPDRATSSICPKGWRLPTGGEGGEFQTLYGYYNSYADMTANTAGPEFALGGALTGAGITNQDKYGYYWSNTASSTANRSYRLHLHGDNVDTVNPLDHNYKYLGVSLRCLAHDNSYSILGVNPNGGTWSGSTSSQTFAQAPESTQTISNPTTNATYSISYDMGSTGIVTPSSPTSASRPFTGWTASLGEGATFVPASGLYTYGTGNSSLVAQYSSTSSSFNLPDLIKSGYNCSWHQSSATGTKVKDNVVISGDTKFYAVCEQPSLAETCADASIGSTFTYPSTGGIQYIKLKTNSAGTTSACYTKSSQGTATWANASSKCPSGTGVPSQTDFNNLIIAYGYGSGLNNATGWGPGSSSTLYWSSTEYNSARAYRLVVRSSSAAVGYYPKSDSYNVVCIVR